MQASIEIFSDIFHEPLHEHLHKLAEKRGHVYEYSQVNGEHSYCVMLGHDYWRSYRYPLLKYVCEHMSVGTRLEFDRQGDEMDKYILYTYEGGQRFGMEYKTDNVTINGELIISSDDYKNV